MFSIAACSVAHEIITLQWSVRLGLTARSRTRPCSDAGTLCATGRPPFSAYCA